MNLKKLMSIGRFKDIVAILLKYGFEDLINRLDIPGSKFIKKISTIDQTLGTFERIRCACEALGPTFIKFGQIMSLRPDLVPLPLIRELSRLQDDVAPLDIEQINQVIEQSTGKPLKETLAVFDVEPIAAASISQVHRGVLKGDGRIASIKVQRPGIRAKMQTDLDILAALAEQLHERVEELRSFDLPNLVRLVRRTLLRELDFKREVRNMKIARIYANNDSQIYIPEVYEEYCTEHILVMEFVQGTKLKDFETESIADAESLAKQGLIAAINQILQDGFFHADPHPGNVLITQNERICLIDWGMIGRLSQRDRHQLITLLKAVLDKDGEGIVYALLRISHAEGPVAKGELERELLDILDSHYSVPIKEMNVGQLLMSIIELLRTYRLRLPPDFVIMAKALVTAEGTARCIYPELDVVSEARAHVTKLAFERYKPESLWRSLRSTLSQLFNLQKDIPKRIDNILSMMDRGEMTLGFRHENLDGLMNTLNNITNRLSFAIIIAAMIIGSSMIITTGVKPLLFGFPALGVMGYLISGLLGIWLLVNIIRKKK